MKNKAAFMLLLVLITCNRAKAVPPAIHARWDNNGPADQPILDQDYEIAGTPDQPDVRLLTGRDDWRIWSTDPDNPNGVGDIGVISSPAAGNFAVAIVNDSGGFGARDVKAIRLVPSSGSHYSNVRDNPEFPGNGSWISGRLIEELTVQADPSGTGGEVSLNVGGAVAADVTIHKVNRFDANAASGTITIEELNQTSIGVFSGNMNIGRTTGVDPVIRFFFMEGTLNVSEVASSTGFATVFFPAGMSATSSLTLGQISANAFTVDLGDGSTDPCTTCSPVAGSIVFLAGIPSGMTVTVSKPLTGVIDLNGADLGGILTVVSGGSGSIVQGGNVSGWLTLGHQSQGADFMGTAGFAGASPSGQVTINGAGTLEFSGTFDGNLCGTNPTLSASTPLPDNIHLAAIGDNGRICDTAVCGETAVALPDPSGLSKCRFISFSTAETRERAVRVTLTSLHHVDPPYTAGPSIPFTQFEGQVRWVGPPTQYVESVSDGTPFYASFLQCTPHYQDWSTAGLVHVTGTEVVPSSEYEIEMNVGANAACAPSLTVQTTRFGDIVAPYNPPDSSAQPDFSDIGALVNKFKSAPGAPIKARALLFGGSNGEINISPDVSFLHITGCADAFNGKAYPYQPTGTCP